MYHILLVSQPHQSGHIKIFSHCLTAPTYSFHYHLREIKIDGSAYVIQPINTFENLFDSQLSEFDHTLFL